MYFTNKAHIRINRDTSKKVDELLDAFPDRFTTQSEVIRVAIHYMHRRELLEPTEEAKKKKAEDWKEWNAEPIPMR